MSLSRRAAPAIVVAAAVFACSPEEAQLVALHGCGIDQQGELSALRVTVRGDFPPTGDTELLLSPGEGGRFSTLPDDAAALTVEGLIGDFAAAVGRTRGVGDDEMVVYFAPPNSLCSVPSGVDFREAGGVAVGEDGDVLIAGGRKADGSLTDELVHVDLDAETAQVLATTLPAPTVGQSLHAAGGRRFLMVGGARSGDPWFSTLHVDLARGQDPISSPAPLIVGGEAHGVAYHAASRTPDGRIMVAGGCTAIDQAGACATAMEPEPSRVSSRVFWIDPVTGDVEAGPDLGQRRFGASLLVGRDGVAYVVGGMQESGQPVPPIERLAAGDATWETVAELPDAVSGAALIEDGLVIVAHADGALTWVGDTQTGVVELGQTLSPAAERPVLALPGEGVLTDAWLVPVGSGEGEEAEAIDLAAETPPGVGPPQRVAPEVLSLADGSVLVVAGRSLSGVPAVPFLARIRPALDGPDERVPDVATPEPGAFVSNPPGAGLVDGKELVLSAGTQIEEFPSDRVHVRGFRSRRFGFDFVVQADGARAHVLVSQGALQALSIRLDPDGVLVRQRSARGEISEPDCEVGPDPQLDTSASLQLDVSPAAVTLEQGGVSLLRCPGIEGPAAAVGLGVSGQGEVRVRQMRLSRR